jgi:protein TonB
MEAARDPIRELVERIHRDRSRMVAAVLVVAAAHAGVGVAAGKWRVGPAGSRKEAPTEVIDLDIAKQPPPAPPLREPSPPPTATATPSDPPKAAALPSPPAQAAAVLTKAAAPDDPVDLTGDGFVVGSASKYAGGETTAGGTTPHLVRGPTGPVGASSEPPSPRARIATFERDRSRRASVMGGAEWHCPFPPEADADQIDSAVVTIRVDVSPNGTVARLALLTDPGHGFGREAERCAAGKRWSPALDPAGNPIEGAVTVRVRFDR